MSPIRHRPYLLTDKDVLILRMIGEAHSIVEIQEALLLKSPASIHRRIMRMQDKGLINPPPKARQARSRTLTDLGKEALELYGATRKSPSETTKAA